MERCRAADHLAGPADPRMAAYLDGKHHPQQALEPRIAFVALDGHDVAGYIAAHATTRMVVPARFNIFTSRPNFVDMA